MPVPPTSISAATITSHAMPMLMRMPVRMVGAAAGRITSKALRSGFTSSVRATFSHSRRTRGHAERGVDQHRPDRADEDHEDARDRRVLDRVERERHPGERRDRLQHLDERIERAVDQRRHADQEAERDRDQRREAEAQRRRGPASARAACRCPCRSGRCRRTGRQVLARRSRPSAPSVGKPDFAASRLAAGSLPISFAYSICSASAPAARRRRRQRREVPDAEQDARAAAATAAPTRSVQRRARRHAQACLIAKLADVVLGLRRDRTPCPSR